MGNRMLPEYPKDPLRYSRNIEKSKAVNVPYLNKTMAAQMESNIIFDAEHYLPHHVMLNTTINVLGQSWNLFEVSSFSVEIHQLKSCFQIKENHLQNRNLNLLRSSKNPLFFRDSDQAKPLGQ